MTSGSDGSIIIDTELDSSGFDKGSDRFLKSIQDLAGAVDTLGDNMMQSFGAMLPVLQEVATNTSNIYAAMTGEGAQAAETVERVAEAEQTAAQGAQNMAEGARTAGEAVSSSMGAAGQSASKLQGQLDRVNQQIAALQAEINRGESAKLPYVQQANELRQKIKEAEAEARHYQQMWAAGTPGADRDQTASEAKVSALKAQYAAVVAEIDKMDAALSKPHSKMDGLQQKAAALTAQLSQIGGDSTPSAAPLSASLAKAGASALALAKNLAKVAGNGVKAGFEKLKGKIMSLHSANKRASLSSNGLVKALTSIKTMLKSWIKRMFISYLMNEIKQSMAALVQYSAAFNASVSGMRNAARGLGANLAVAFSGLVNAVAPAITTIINLLSKAISYLNAFFAALSGKATVTVAKKQTESYADSLKNATGAAKDLKKARQLLSFDELNILSDKKDSGAGGGAGGTATPDLYEEVPIDKLLPEDVSAWFDSIKKAFEKGDWKGVGGAIAKGVNTAVASVDKQILKKLQPAAKKWAGRIAGALNGFVEKTDWEQVGKTVADGLNTIIVAADTFLRELDARNIGAAIGATIRGWFQNFDFDSVAGIVISLFNGVSETIGGFLDEKPFDGLPEKLSSAINRIFTEVDWALLGSNLSQLFLTLLGTFHDTIAQIDWHQVGVAIGEFLGSIDWCGVLTEVAELIWTVFSEVLLGTFTGILDGLFDSENGTIFLALSTALIGLKLAFTGAKAHWAAAAGELAAAGLNPLQAIPETLGVLAKNIGIAALGVADAVLLAYDYKALKDAADTYSEVHETHLRETKMALENFKKVYEEVGPEAAASWAKTCYDIDTSGLSLEEGQRAIAEKVESFWDGTPENMWEGFSAGWDMYFGKDGKGLLALLGDAFNGAVSGICDLLGIHSPSTVFEDIGKNLVAGLTQGISGSWHNVTTFLTGAAEGVGSYLSEAWANIQTDTGRAWDGIKTTVSNLCSDLKATVESTKWDDIGANMVAGLKNGITNSWSSLTNKVNSLCNNLTKTAKGAFKEHSPSKVFAEIGQYLDEGMAVGIDKGENSLLRTVRNLAGNVTNTMSDASPEVQIAGHATLAGMNNVTQALGGIADKFSAIAAVLNDMGGLKVPAIAAGTVAPYQTGLSGNGKDSLGNLMAASNEELISVIIQVANNLAGAVVSAIQQGNARPVVLDSESVTTGVINEINRRTLSSGESPLLA